jgi:RNA polymerase sigma factor (sigma-70 family)
MVRTIARRNVRYEDDVDDVVQDVWLSFAKSLARIRSPEALRGWLSSVTKRAAWRASAHHSRAVPVSELRDLPAQEDHESTVVDRLYGAQFLRALAEALDRLKADDRRMVILLTRASRPDYRRVSELTGRPIGSIGPTRQRVLSQLRTDPAIRTLLNGDD